ncbi:MAG: prolyl oligopeptidase family serine peptidase [Erysipelotrichaceae bacterium]|nr:prolyl oligopeptidase family serine peptidase [Erysipelotrichaceae bacterium]
MKSIKEKYTDAEKLLLKHTHNAVLNGKPKAVKIDDNFFYYAKESGYPLTEYEFVKVDIRTGEKSLLFDHDELRKSLKESFGDERITFKNIDYKEDEIGFDYKGKTYVYKNGNISEVIKEDTGSDVCNEYYHIFTKDFNLYREDLRNKEIIQLSSDGSDHNSYAGILDDAESVTKKVRNRTSKLKVNFSHDGKKMITYRLDERDVKDLYIIQAYDEDGRESIRPRLHTYKVCFPEDEEYSRYYYYIFDLEKGTSVKIDYKPFTKDENSFMWSRDDSFIIGTWVERGYQNAVMLKIDPDNGKCEEIVCEHSDTFLNLATYGIQDSYGKYHFSNFISSDGKRAFFQSERDDYARFFEYDVKTKECLGPVTPEDSIATNIIYVDEENEYIYYLANCISLYSDPYYQGLCRVHFDGSEFEVLNKEDGFHMIQFMDTYYLDTYSRVDLPPVTNLCDLDGNIITVIEKADISNLLELGYIIPKRFTVKARDGKTDLYGILIEPEHKEGETVPYVDHIYGGPQMYFVPKEFTYDHYNNREIFGGLESLAKLGIAGIIIDGLGTPGRGKKLHDYSWLNIHGNNGLLDHVTMAKELKEKFPFLDTDNVGIWGNSGGGCATSRALLEYPDYFKVGVSSAGNHDQRMYNNEWTERYYGLYNDEHKDAYITGDNTSLAKNLKGHLLIVHGMMDDNVTMSQSIRLVDALIKEDKDFDFLILPRVNHNVPADPYFQRIKLDYFVKHLLGIDPPEDHPFKKEAE